MSDAISPRPRLAGRATVNTQISSEAAEMLKEMASGKRYGRLIEALIFREHARREERQRVAKLVQAGVEDGGL